MIDIKALGWDGHFEQEFTLYGQKGLAPARVIARMAHQYRMLGCQGERDGVLSGKFMHAAEQGDELPAVGDWVAVEEKGNVAVIHALLPRKTCFARKPAISGGRKLKHGVIQGGTTARQVLAANIDTVFVVSGLDGNYNSARTERFLAVAAASGAAPVLVLNKADLCPDASAILDELNAIARSVPVLVVSAAADTGMENFASYVQRGKTVVFLGSSGVGKSTIINHLFDTGLQSTQEVSAVTGKGRHTTTRAELLIHGSGAMLIDTPGIRELQLWCDEQAVDDSFDDVTELAARCRFSDCRHRTEPDCAVREAIREGRLSPERYERFCKLSAEARRLTALKKQKEIMLGRKQKYSPR